MQELPVEETVYVDLDVANATQQELLAALDDEFVLALLTLALAQGGLSHFFTHEDPQRIADEVVTALRHCIRVAVKRVS